MGSPVGLSLLPQLHGKVGPERRVEEKSPEKAPFSEDGF